MEKDQERSQRYSMMLACPSMPRGERMARNFKLFIRAEGKPTPWRWWNLALRSHVIGLLIEACMSVDGLQGPHAWGRLWRCYAAPLRRARERRLTVLADLHDARDWAAARQASDDREVRVIKKMLFESMSAEQEMSRDLREAQARIAELVIELEVAHGPHPLEDK